MENAKQGEVSTEFPENSFLAIVDLERPGENFFWDGSDGWLDFDSIKKWYKTCNPHKIQDELIKISALGFQGQAMMVSLAPKEILEGASKGRWTVGVKAHPVDIKISGV